MYQKIVAFILSISCQAALLAGEGEYAVQKIPAALTQKANAVKRIERIRFEVNNTGEAVLYRKYAITVLNENGDQHAYFSEYYDKLHEIRNVEGTLYDAGGKELKRLKNKQLMDLSGAADANLVDDNRYKVHRFFHKVYPYTVEYEVEIRYNGTLFFPVWIPREDDHYSVEHSSITIAFKPGYTVRYKEFNYSGKPTAAQEKTFSTLSWEARNLPAMDREYAMPSWVDLNTAVLFAPTDFEIENYQGNMNNWNEFGKFVYALKKERDQLPAHIKQTVQQIAGAATSPRDKIEKLYAYMQKNTRYISIQLGIGGWQPFDAAYVASKSYGDCKALTNYMYSLLKEVGVKSYYTLVNAGHKARKVIADFPSQQFNHVILCVPVATDTVWLECTSQTLPAGYLSDFTCDRYALLIGEEGGTLVRTPKYGLKENTQVRHIKAVLNADATLDISSKTAYGGLQQDRYHDLINQLSKDKVKEALHEDLDFATYDIKSFDYKELRQSLPFVEESLEIAVSNYATITGKRLFIIPNVMTRHQRKLNADTARKYDVDLSFEYKDTDTVEISLPEGFSAESMPQDQTIASPFGKYTASVKYIGNKLIYYRNLEHYAGRFPPGQYNELVGFYEKVYKADRSKVVLVKKEEPKETKGF